MDFKDKAKKLADKMNDITAKIHENTELAEDLDLVGDDIIEYVEEKTQDVQLLQEDICIEKIVNLNNMVDDFKFVREGLKENITNGRKILNSLTLDLLDTDDDKRASLVMSYAELNKALVDNMKLFTKSYKEISDIIVNIDKVKKTLEKDPGVINNTVNINSTEAINTTELIKKLKGN